MFNAALELSELERSGARFIYPTGLRVFQWEALRALTRGRDRAEALEKQREKKKKKKN